LLRLGCAGAVADDAGHDGRPAVDRSAAANSLMVREGPGSWSGSSRRNARDEPQILALFGAFCLAGIRQQRTELWWMWTLTLIPWYLWLTADVPNLHGPASATIAFTAAVIAVDSVGSRLRAQHALAAQTERTEDERARRAVAALEQFGLTGAADRMVKTYSGGMRRRLDIAASLAGRPPVLFLDEPTTGLDPRTRNDLWGFVKDLVTGGTTVLLTTQYMEEAERLADQIAVLDAGRVIAQGTAAELKDQVGGGVLEARVTSPADLHRAAQVLAATGDGQPRINTDQQQVSVASRNGTADLVAAGRRFEEHHIALDDLGIRHPSLEDVFLALTGDARTGNTQDPRRAPVPPAEPADQAATAGQARRPAAPAPRVNPVTAARDCAGIAKRTLLHMPGPRRRSFSPSSQP
jgi:ABC-2 type transport system ATP-binding protein